MSHLQLDNGKEFVSSIIIELVNLWPTIQIINGRPTSQKKWMEDNNHQDWSFGLRFVIYAMNNLVCKAHNKKPYEFVFGGTLHEYSAMLNQFQNNIFSEDEILNEFEESIQESINNLDDLIDNTTYEINSTNLNQELNLNEDAVNLTNQLTRRHQVLQDFACQNLETYTTKMTSAIIAKSKHKLEYEIKEYIKILIPKIDRFDTNRPVLPCKVIEKLNYNDTFKYRLGCISGILNNLYYAGELKEYLELDHIPTDNISVREAARNQSSSTGMLTGSMCKCNTIKWSI
ncbi:13151_t:CDS:2 [Rhizophagus irregularis]|nr:13151_t:CDS:2 [Rhizophagus irregularis]